MLCQPSPIIQKFDRMKKSYCWRIWRIIRNVPDLSDGICHLPDYIYKKHFYRVCFKLAELFQRITSKDERFSDDGPIARWTNDNIQGSRMTDLLPGELMPMFTVIILRLTDEGSIARWANDNVDSYVFI